MAHSTTSDRGAQAASLDLTLLLRARVREALEAVLDEELAAALGYAASERSRDRAGYHHGAVTRVNAVSDCPLSICRRRCNTPQKRRSKSPHLKDQMQGC